MLPACGPRLSIQILVSYLCQVSGISLAQSPLWTTFKRLSEAAQSGVRKLLPFLSLCYTDAVTGALEKRTAKFLDPFILTPGRPVAHATI